MVEFDTHDGPERQRLAQQQTQDAMLPVLIWEFL